jgi:hypothetical protein
MRYETTMVAVLTLTAWLSFTCPTRSEPRRQLEEQTRFSLEEPIKHPVPIPEDVLKILRQEADITTCEIRPEERSKIPPSWYEASGIRLDGEREEDLIVKAKNACMWGPNLGPFWVFRSSVNGHYLVLSTVAVSLQVLKSSTNGLRNIRTAAIVTRQPAYSDYRFDGHTYQLAGGEKSKHS